MIVFEHVPIRKFTMKYSLPVFLGLCLSGAALADEVELTNGRKLVVIASEGSGQVVIETRHGTVTVKADEVKSITPGRTSMHEYQERLADLGGRPQVEQVFGLAVWAQEQGLI